MELQAGQDLKDWTEPTLCDILMEGWLLVSCSSSSMQEVMKEFSAAASEDRFRLGGHKHGLA